ncbi:MAG: LiaI-LiaF-like domain-containing protein [Burkholderiales bacterium]
MSRHGRGGRFGAMVLILVGVIGLLANFGLVEKEVLRQLWKLWPLIPLAIGIGILLRPRSGGQ